MIGWLQGVLQHVEPEEILLNVGGVGYRLKITKSVDADLPSIGETVEVYVHTHVREDAIVLYGFKTQSELRLFETLIGVTGVGPKLALSILSNMDPDHFVRSVIQGETSRLTKIPGIGKKTAARLVLELKDRVKNEFEATYGQAKDGTDTTAVPVDDQVMDDATEALLALGFSPDEAQAALTRARSESQQDASAETLMRVALKYLDRSAS